MKNSTYEFRNPGYQLTLLDANTRLRMTQPEESRVRSAQSSAQALALQARSSITKDSLSAAILLVGFTALFWVLLGYIRTH